jgi:hypothetical protein
LPEVEEDTANKEEAEGHPCVVHPKFKFTVTADGVVDLTMRIFPKRNLLSKFKTNRFAFETE